MTETLIHHVQGAMSSPWVYALLFALAAIDGFFPVVPGESAVITVGVFAASGRPELFAVIGVAALGAAAGDHTSYLIGRTSGRARAGGPPWTGRPGRCPSAAGSSWSSPLHPRRPDRHDDDHGSARLSTAPVRPL